MCNTATTIEDFVLKIRYKDRQLFLEASEVLKSKVCGIFGNWNGVNDVELPDNADGTRRRGASKREYEQLLMEEFIFPEASVDQTFEFVDQEFDCSTPVVYDDCPEDDELVYRAICEEINGTPFDHCELDRSEVIEECVFDLCLGIDEDETVCEMFENYVSRCNTRGASQNFIKNWRGERCKVGQNLKNLGTSFG